MEFNKKAIYMEIRFELHDKLNMLLELLCDGNDDKLANYFLDNRKKYKDDSNRTKHIKALIRNKNNKYTKDFKESYKNYKISTIFTLDEFINSSEHEFRKIIEEYIRLRDKTNNSILYPYMYIFDREHKDKIYCYQINYKCKEKGRIQKITMKSLETDDINEQLNFTTKNAIKY